MKDSELIPIEDNVRNALKALKDGVASDGQQKAVLRWILFDACRLGELSFDVKSERGTSFSEGRRYVGLNIARYIENEIKPTTENEAK